MLQTEIREQLLEGCQRLADKGLLTTPRDSFSLRVPGQMEMLFISRCDDWHRTSASQIRTVRFSTTDPSTRLHAYIYQERGDVGWIAISSPKWARLLARNGGKLPPIFDEQARHIGPAPGLLMDREPISRDVVRETLRRGTNAMLLGSRLLSLGMTRDRVLFNAELYEKCAQAYLLAKTCSPRISRIPRWVRFIATRRLLKDERMASASYRDGRIPEGNTAY